MTEFAPKQEIKGEASKVETLDELRIESQHELAAQNAPDKAEQAEAARSALEQVAEKPIDNPLDKLNAAEKAATEAPIIPASKQEKANALRLKMKHVQAELPVPAKVLSKVVHQKAVRVVSEAAGKTVSRPSGLLGGGVVAFLGSTSYLLLAKHLGFQYNYLLFLMLFVGGFVVGLVLELLTHTFTQKRT